MIWGLLFLYQTKHFLADYPLQGQYMLQKFKGRKDWILPLAAHAGVHGGFTFCIALVYTRKPLISLALSLLDFGVHFVVDRIKASPNLLGRFKALSGTEFKNLFARSNQISLKFSGMNIFDKKEFVKTCETLIPEKIEINKAFQGNKYFWWALGWDQAMHHCTHYALIYLILAHKL